MLKLCNKSGNKMLEIMKFRAWLRDLGLNLIMDESELRAQSLKVEARAFRAFEQLVHLWTQCDSLNSIKPALGSSLDGIFRIWLYCWTCWGIFPGWRIYKLTLVVKLPKWLVSLGADSLGAPAEWSFLAVIVRSWLYWWTCERILLNWCL